MQQDDPVVRSHADVDLHMGGADADGTLDGPCRILHRVGGVAAMSHRERHSRQSGIPLQKFQRFIDPGRIRTDDSIRAQSYGVHGLGALFDLDPDTLEPRPYKADIIKVCHFRLQNHGLRSAGQIDLPHQLGGRLEGGGLIHGPKIGKSVSQFREDADARREHRKIGYRRILLQPKHQRRLFGLLIHPENGENFSQLVQSLL